MVRSLYSSDLLPPPRDLSQQPLWHPAEVQRGPYMDVLVAPAEVVRVPRPRIFLVGIPPSTPFWMSSSYGNALTNHGKYGTQRR